jgi:hypothetical protein
MRLLVSGYRKYVNRKVILDEILDVFGSYPVDEKHTIIHGGCPTGVDAVAHTLAIEKGWIIEVYPANWSLGKAAGPMRNEQMIIEGEPEFALLFLAPESKGTKNMLELVQKYKIAHTLIQLS